MAFQRTRRHENVRMREEGLALLEQMKAMYGPQVAARLWAMGPSRGTRSAKYFADVVLAFAEEDILRFVQTHAVHGGKQHGGSMEDLRTAFANLKERFLGGAGRVTDLVTKGVAKTLDAATLENFVKMAGMAAAGCSVVYGPQVLEHFSTSWSSIYQLLIQYAPESLTLIYNACQTLVYSAGMASLGLVGTGAVAAFLGTVIVTQKTVGAIHKGALKGAVGIMNAVYAMDKMSVEDLLVKVVSALGGADAAEKVRSALSKCAKGSLKEGVACSETPLVDSLIGAQEQEKVAQAASTAEQIGLQVSDATAAAASMATKHLGITVYEVGTSRILFKLYGPNAKVFAEKMLATANVSMSPIARRTRRRRSRSRSRSRSPTRNVSHKPYGDGYRRVTRSSVRSSAHSSASSILTRSKLASIRESR